jgi:hypothetical protein
MNINQYNSEGKPHGYWHELLFTVLSNEHYQYGVFDNGIKIGSWSESIWTKDHRLYKDCYVYFESDLLEGESVNFNY